MEISKNYYTKRNRYPSK